MLTFDSYIPPDVKAGAPVIVLLHGRGSDKNDLMGLQPGLPQNAIIIAPRAPFSGAAWGYGGGWAWYRFLGGTLPEPQSFERSMAELGELISAIPDLLPVKPGPLIVGGFSQGGTTALAFALSHPGAIDGVLLFSGFVATHPSVQANLALASGLRVFWGHGTQDPMIPFENAISGRAILAGAGAEVTARDYPIGHWIEPHELADAHTWLTSFNRVPIGTKS